MVCNNIAIIGFMGTGKSTVSKALAERLGRECISIDALIEKRMRKKICKIFSEDDGENKFRKLESEILRYVLEKNKNAVIDCGGGIILKKKNRNILKKNTTIICLTAKPHIVLARVSQEKEKRPLLNVPNKIRKIKEILLTRERLYKEISDITIDTSKMSVKDIVNEICQFLKRRKNVVVKAPASKSLTNRALIIASLAKGTSTLRNVSFCEDTFHMINSLRVFGIRISKKKNKLLVNGTGGKLVAYGKKELFVGNSGTAMRFLTTFAGLSKGGEITIRGNERMNKRPIQDLIDALKQSGVAIHSKNNNGCPPVVIKSSKFFGGNIKLNGTTSSQYLSSLLMCAPFAKEGAKIEIIGELTSKPYVDMTIDLMKRFGVMVKRKDYKKFNITKQKYKARDILLEGDATNASYFFALAAITKGTIRVNEINPKTIQGDIKFLDILKQMGCKIKKGKDWVEIQGRTLRGITTDMNSMPDVVPTLAIVALFAKGRTKIKNVKNLRIKETDRLRALTNELEKIGAKVKELEDGLLISPVKKLKECKIETYNDHRIAMSFGILSLVEPRIKIKNPNCVKKSFPEFWKILRRIKNEWK
ncbi:MAG: 3-phosphoshikimate 1-carboxyvinyltransferase [Candidatus Altiarchaeota archaeon]